MSIMNCPRCSNSYDSDQHTEPLCKTCMGKVTTSMSINEDEHRRWMAIAPLVVAWGRTEDEAISNLVRAI